MVIWTAAHEYEEVINPVGHSKLQHMLVERRNGFRIGRKESDMPKLQRSYAGYFLVAADMAAFGKKLDHRSIRIPKRQQRANAGGGVTALLALDPLVGKQPAHGREICARSDFER